VGQELSAALFYLDQYSLDLSLLLLSRDGELTAISESTKQHLDALSVADARLATRKIQDGRENSHLRFKSLEISGGDYLVVAASADDAVKRLRANVVTAIAFTGATNLLAFIVLSLYIRRLKRRDDVDALARMQEFLGDASHELRTPLTVIKGYVEMLSKGQISEQSDQVRAFTRVNHEILRMEGLIHDLLLLAELGESGNRSKETIDVTELVTSYSEDFITLNPDRTVVTDIESGIEMLSVRDYLARYIQNALTNISRHTPADAPVKITLSRKGKLVELVIEDGGPGLPSSAYSENIRTLNRFDPSRSRESGGSGLGMSIMAAVISKAGGTMALAPSSLGGLAVKAELP
jgi:K+-sensing histidine kinase KdpD